MLDLQLQLPGKGLREELDRGPRVQRQWFTAAVTPVKGQLILNLTDYSTLITFWETTLSHGVLAFNWKHPITQEAAVFQFNPEEPIVVEGLGQDKVLATLLLEILP